MARTVLLDVNVLVALFHPDHIHHDLAHDWFADHRHLGWATCAVTENGFVRVASQEALSLGTMRSTTIVGHFRKFCASGHHHFWADAVSLRDATLFDSSYLAGPKQITDIYLLGLAKKAGGRLATFDRTIPTKSVVGATTDLLAIIEP